MAEENAETAETAFDPFRDLARKLVQLVQVPKREGDAEQAKEDERWENDHRD